MTLAMTSCRDDEFTETIFKSDGNNVDSTKATYAFDQWIFDNFTAPFNTTIDYQMYTPATNLEYQLCAPDYERSVVLAQLIRYLFFDLYTGEGGDEFMRKYAPRKFLFVGSVGYDATNGSRTLGYASGGVMITLMNVNSINLKRVWSGRDLDNLNHEIFHTMHHEFSHILQQTRTTPVSFGKVTPSDYEPNTWGDRDSLSAHAMGFVTNYASSASTEDFVEVISSIITDGDGMWMHRIIDGTLDGVNTGVKAQLDSFIVNLGIDIDDPKADWNNFDIYEDFDKEGIRIGYSTNLVGERSTEVFENYDKRTKLQHVSSFRDYLKDFVQEDPSLGNKGMTAILQKVDISINDWYAPTFKLNVYNLRSELKKRQNAINDWFKNDFKEFPLAVESK